MAITERRARKADGYRRNLFMALGGLLGTCVPRGPIESPTDEKL
jgi:hypothetical protein